MQDDVQHLRRIAALGDQRVIAETGMLAHLDLLFFAEQARLVEDRGRDERLADVVQQRGAHQPALVVFAHAEMLRKGNGKAGHEQAVTVAVGVMAADGGQPFAQ